MASEAPERSVSAGRVLDRRKMGQWEGVATGRAMSRSPMMKPMCSMDTKRQSSFDNATTLQQAGRGVLASPTMSHQPAGHVPSPVKPVGAMRLYDSSSSLAPGSLGARGGGEHEIRSPSWSARVREDVRVDAAAPGDVSMENEQDVEAELNTMVSIVRGNLAAKARREYEAARNPTARANQEDLDFEEGMERFLGDDDNGRDAVAKDGAAVPPKDVTSAGHRENIKQKSGSGDSEKEQGWRSDSIRHMEPGHASGTSGDDVVVYDIDYDDEDAASDASFERHLSTLNNLPAVNEAAEEHPFGRSSISLLFSGGTPNHRAQTIDLRDGTAARESERYSGDYADDTSVPKRNR